ncbi:hypothetical protein APUTEX25_003012 [Auxenochlorella protothecoides]|uniref:Uncharacterized protein n=1 Tax=Auxenochlorella protothecoides TaxID=3075 RepID=A0A3M7KXP0_AUXPR|nr:hypothetical protein APUTEX25_003012 [Auxenochlorella protothecoides]|eukprot:RMZ54634.1 hypothetical protein APUTEX25_003012 [Auxenochlorella protothecoides]
MPAKAKRNSSNQLESLATPKKPIKPGAYGLRQDGSVLHATLPPGKPLVFLGEAVLHVMRGRALFNGATLGSGSVCSIAADAVNSGPLLISQAAEGNHFPFAPTASVLYLQLRPLPAEQRLSGGLGSTTAARMADDVGYQAWLHNDPSAPGCLATPDIWSQAVEEMAGLAYPGAVYAVVGSKKVGKSTLGRLLVNELLSTHNCGQPEFGPPGLVSLSLVSRPLTGPPFLHPAHPPLASYFVGDVSPASHPQRYAACVAALRAAHGALAPERRCWSTPMAGRAARGWRRCAICSPPRARPASPTAAGTDGDGSEGARAQCASREDAVPLLAEAAVRAPRAPRTLLGPRCLGVGIVRAVDGERRRVLLLAPLPPAELAGVDTLQLGRLELPGPLLQTPGARAPYMSVHCLPTLGTGAGAIRSRNNLARARQADRGD